jgi:hypothetical protein
LRATLINKSTKKLEINIMYGWTALKFVKAGWPRKTPGIQVNFEK